MAKVEVVKVTHTYIIQRDGEAIPEIPEPIVRTHTRNASGLVVEYEETTAGAYPPSSRTPPLLARILGELDASS